MFLKLKDLQWQSQPILGNFDARKTILRFREACNGCSFYFLASFIKNMSYIKMSNIRMVALKRVSIKKPLHSARKHLAQY